MRILISPFSSKTQTGIENAKNYPYWKELIKYLQKDGHHIIQIGVEGEKKLVDEVAFNLSMRAIEKVLRQCDIFISVDNFLPHMAHYLGKKGIVIWGPSDYKIFGYPENKNLCGQYSAIRSNQFDDWNNCKYYELYFVPPELVVKEVDSLI